MKWAAILEPLNFTIHTRNSDYKEASKNRVRASVSVGSDNECRTSGTRIQFECCAGQFECRVERRE